MQQHRPALTFIALSLSMLAASALFVSALSVIALPVYAQFEAPNEAQASTGGIVVDAQ